MTRRLLLAAAFLTAVAPTFAQAPASAPAAPYAPPASTLSSLFGRYTVRGYPQNTLVRDDAFVASLEARVPIVRDKRWADHLELTPFFDYGAGWNTSRSTPEPHDISSVGIGLRWGASLRGRVPLRAQAEIYWGYPLRKIETPASATEAWRCTPARGGSYWMRASPAGTSGTNVMTEEV